ncbi:MAG: ATP-binding cassette domain-containing protein [Acidobacteriaceae bacterium]|nr:ATP-binding cassette domain-containing protein [Acidobacteriaceae bacterium]MBV8569960.1 ATP-binding cassette domain-containing protein [Acidobacteriaceae bacterium]
MIQVQGLSKRYARHVAVNNISFSVEKGDIVGFLGPNGAGKTTTMRILTCFMPPTEGKATVAGYDVFEKPHEVKKHIGYLPEAPPLYPEMSVEDYLTFVARLKNVPVADVKSRTEQVMERCACADVRNRLISKLSKGYRQRVGLAQAIIHNPDVLILDEPTSGLDPKQINETRELIKSLAGEHTIILSTHILPEVEAVCQKVIIINKGRLVATDSVENLKTRAGVGSAIQVQIDTAGEAEAFIVRQRLEQVAGVSKVLDRGASGSRFVFEIESLEGRNARADIARAVVHAGWNLLELKSSTLTLEEVFLELTGSHTPPPPVATPAAATGVAQ